MLGRSKKNQRDFEHETLNESLVVVSLLEVMENVLFMNNEEGDDLIVSFAIECSDPGDVKSLILLRTPQFEFILQDHERGVTVSHDDEPEVEDNLLRRICMAPQVVTIESTYNRYELDVSRVHQEQLSEACAILHKMNFDNRFTFEAG